MKVAKIELSPNRLENKTIGDALLSVARELSDAGLFNLSKLYCVKASHAFDRAHAGISRFKWDHLFDLRKVEYIDSQVYNRCKKILDGAGNGQ